MTEFTPDSKIDAAALAYNQDAIDVAKQNFGINLDGSVDSIREAEAILGKLHEAVATQSPTDDEIAFFAKAFGSYVGEVIRREHGGDWRLLAAGDQLYPGLSLGVWPWAKVYNRINRGYEDNVWHYYVALFQAAESV